MVSQERPLSGCISISPLTYQQTLSKVVTAFGKPVGMIKKISLVKEVVTFTIPLVPGLVTGTKSISICGSK